MLTAEAILKIEKVGDLFTNNKDIIKKEYIELTKKFHPDNNGNSPESNSVMSHINNLYHKALSLIDGNKWEGTNFIKITAKNKKAYELRYKATYPFELGTMYIGDTFVLYLINADCAKFYDNGVKNIKSFKYANDKMKTEMSKYLPIILEEFETPEGQKGVVVKKTSDLLLLKDVLNYFKGNIPDRHVAWILSSLYNIACYIDYTGLSHNGISLDNYFISPQYHSGALLGGWWYAVNQGEKMLGVTGDIYNILPPKVKEKKVSNIVTDLEAIRFIGKQLLGEKNGCKIKYNPDVPKPFINWLLAGSSQKAVDEYEKWHKSLDNAYGKRKFVKMELTANELY